MPVNTMNQAGVSVLDFLKGITRVGAPPLDFETGQTPTPGRDITLYPPGNLNPNVGYDTGDNMVSSPGGDNYIANPGDIGGQTQPQLQDTSQFPMLPIPNAPPDAGTGGYPGIPNYSGGIMDNPVLNPTVNPEVVNMGVPDYYPGMMQGGETQYTGTGAQARPDAQQAANQPFNENAFYDKYMSRYTPEHSAQDYYNQLMQQYPQRNMHPGFMRRLAAAFSGFGGGAEASQRVLDEPYNSAVADWKNQMTPALNSANLEKYANINERQLVSQEATRATNQQKAEIAQQLADEKARHDLAVEKDKEARTTAYTFAREHPDWQKILPPGGNVIFYNPQHPEQRMTTDIPVGKLTDTDRIMLGLWAKEQTIDAKEQADEKLAGVKGWKIIDIQDPNDPSKTIKAWVKGPGAEGEAPQTITPKDEGGKPITVTPKGAKVQTDADKKVGQYLRAQEAVNTHPDWKPWVQLEKYGANTFEITDYTESGKGLVHSLTHWMEEPEQRAAEAKSQKDSKKSYDELVKFVYGPEGKNLTRPTEVQGEKPTAIPQATGKEEAPKPVPNTPTESSEPPPEATPNSEGSMIVVITEGPYKGRIGNITKEDYDPNTMREATIEDIKAKIAKGNKK